MSVDKQTKDQIKKYFSSKKFIVAAIVFLLAVGTGVGTFMSVKRELNEQLSSIAETHTYERESKTEEAANEITGETEIRTDLYTENITVAPPNEYAWPAGDKIIKDFSDSVAVKSKTMNDWRVHNGVDFSVEKGGNVHAIQSGAVLAIYNSSLWGTIVEIDHGAGITARYCGLAEDCRVTANDVVEKGQVIGVVDEMPVESADGYHLHLEILKEGVICDPFEFFVKN